MTASYKAFKDGAARLSHLTDLLSCRVNVGHTTCPVPVHKKRKREGQRERGRESGNKNKRLMALGTRSICFPVAVAMSLPLVLCNVLTFNTSLAFCDPHRYRRSSPLRGELLPYLLSRARQGYCSLVRVSNKFVQHISPVCFASFAPSPLSPLTAVVACNIFI